MYTQITDLIHFLQSDRADLRLAAVAASQAVLGVTDR